MPLFLAHRGVSFTALVLCRTGRRNDGDGCGDPTADEHASGLNQGIDSMEKLLRTAVFLE